MTELGVNVDYNLEEEDQFKPWWPRPQERLVWRNAGAKILFTEIPK